MASPLQKLFERFKRKAGVPPILDTGTADPFLIWRSTKRVSPERAMQVYAGWVYACIRAIAEELANMELRLYRVKGDGTREELFDHEVLDLLNAVNDQQTGYEFRYLLGAHLEATGNAYVHLDGVDKEGGQPEALHLLNPAGVTIKKDEESFPSRIVSYGYRQRGKLFTFEPEKILHIQYPDPADQLEGIGTVQALAQWVDADNYAMEFNRRFFLNGARLGGFLESESAVTPEQLEYLKKSFEAVFKGVENAYKIAALPKGTKFQAASESQKDMDFANLQQVMRDKILAGFRVPRTVLGITDDVNRANAEATHYVFMLRTIKPKMKMITSYLNEFLVPRYGDDLVLDFTDPVPENRELTIQERQAALGSKPYKSVNEVREEEGLPAIENGENVMTDFASVPLGAPAEESKAIHKPGAKGNGNVKPAKSRFARASKRRKEIGASIADAAAEALKSIVTKAKEITKKNIVNATDEEYEVLHKAFVTRVTPYENRMADAMREINGKQKEEVQKNLPNALKAVDKTELFDKEKWIAATVDLNEPILVDLYGKEGKEAAALLGITEIDILSPQTREAIRRAVELMAEKYNEATLDLLVEKLTEGQRQGLGLDELGNLVSDIYEFSDKERALRVARTETFRIANDATEQAWKQSGVVKSIKWYTAADERVCPYCRPMHGKVVGIDENFFERGDTLEVPGQPALPLDYEDVGNPPLHVNCRCYIRPEEISLE